MYYLLSPFILSFPTVSYFLCTHEHVFDRKLEVYGIGRVKPYFAVIKKTMFPTRGDPLLIHTLLAGTGFKSPEDFKLSLPLRTNYLFGRVKKSLPEMYAFTVCMWLKSSASPGIGTPFSYGVPGQANEIVLIEWGNNPIELLINDKVNIIVFKLFL